MLVDSAVRYGAPGPTRMNGDPQRKELDSQVSGRGQSL